MPSAKTNAGASSGTEFDILVVGNGHAGATAAIALRQHGFTGSLGLLGEERGLPYERPPLSKEYLAGAKNAEQLLIRPAAFWDERSVAMLTGRRAVALDPATRTVTDAEGATLRYGTLVWAAGGRARRLDCHGNHLDGVHVVRTRADVDRIAADLPRVTHVVVVGGGYIGLEAASVLTKAGKHVTVLEAQERVLARVAGEALSSFYATEHRRRGVDVRVGATVVAVEGDTRATGVVLADGTVLPADMVVVGIGIVPNVEPLLAAGASPGSTGVQVDAECRTSLADVYAVGDCAAQINPHGPGRVIRIESVGNAHDQAQIAARNIVGLDMRSDAVPWFWSDQYDLRLQTVGLSLDHDDAVVRGDPAERSFSVVYLRGDRVIALDCVNAARDFVQGRKLILSAAAPDRDRLADPSVRLADLA